MRVLLVGNPASGSGRGARALETAASLLREAGQRPEIVRTEGRDHARRAVPSLAPGFDRVLACGGDGLISEVAAALAGTEMPLALLPAGRGNDLARALGIPRDLRDAVRLALAGTPRATDLGRANGRTFTTVAACGLDAEVSRGARESRLPLPGAGVYVVELLKQLPRLPRARTRIVVDGVEFEQDIMVVAIANTPTYGGGFLIAPRALPDDGLLDACVIRACTPWRALSLLPRVMPGRHVGLPDVTMLRGRRIEISSEPDLDIEGDGEALTRTPCVFETWPGAVRIVRPD